MPSLRNSVLLPLTLFLATFALALDPIYNARGVAIHGYDPVAYFTDGKPVKGASAFEHRWMGATWRFASAENRDAFAADPDRFAPQYGGYCAWAVSRGSTAPSDPQAWTIVDGKLYLNYGTGIQRKWERDVRGNVAKADANWPELRDN
jgi:YHS domain-containing protein